MAAHLPCLPGSPSVSRRVPTSFVPPAHIQGVSLALLACPYPGCQLSSTSGSCPTVTITCRLLAHSFLFADSSSCSPAPFGGRFLMSFPFRHSLPGAGLLLVTGTGPPIVRLPGSGRKQEFLCVLTAALRLPPAFGCLPSSSLHHT